MNEGNGSEPDFFTVSNQAEAKKEELKPEGFVTISIVQLHCNPSQDVPSALSQVSSTDLPSGVCQMASSVLCLSESEVGARKMHARKTCRLGVCVNPNPEILYAHVCQCNQDCADIGR